MPGPAPRRWVLATAIFSLLIAGLWVFPYFWYEARTEGEDLFWLRERREVPGWTFAAIPVAESAEKLLVADSLVNGEFTSAQGKMIRAFGAKRFTERQNEIGLFVHTPDRCWTQAGWKLQEATPDCVDLEVHGKRLFFERRIFEIGGRPELVYFTGLSSGEALPYRLDHNLGVGLRYHNRKEKTGTLTRAVDTRMWARVWDSFATRTALGGPKQFLRISTPVEHGNLEAAEKLLKEFLGQWLERGDFQEEITGWRKTSQTASR